MNLRDLEYLVVSATEGNFSRAARALGISTSTISRRIGRFEDEMGLAVFERRHSGVRLTKGGKAVLLHARRAVAELEAVRLAGTQNGVGAVGEVCLGVRMPPNGRVMGELLRDWGRNNPDVLLSVSEMNERDLATGLDERRLDAAIAPSQTFRPRLAAMPLLRERIFAALPTDHHLLRRKQLRWPALANEAILVQGWEESQAEREFLLPLLGSGCNCRSHPASRQTILALVAAGFGAAIATESEAEAGCPGVAFKRIDDAGAILQVDLAWMPEAEEPALGRFVAFMRDAARSRGLV